MADPDRRYSASLYWVGHIGTLAVVIITFASLVVLYLTRSIMDKAWKPVAIPPQLLLSTVLLAGASISIELARWQLRRGNVEGYSSWLIRTAVTGLAFVITQLLCWRIMLAEPSGTLNTSRGMFYVLTGAHAIHVACGLFALGYLIWRIWNPWQDRHSIRRSSITFMLATYWHTMFLIWLVLYGLLAANSG